MCLYFWHIQQKLLGWWWDVNVSKSVGAVLVVNSFLLAIRLYFLFLRYLKQISLYAVLWTALIKKKNKTHKLRRWNFNFRVICTSNSVSKWACVSSYFAADHGVLWYISFLKQQILPICWCCCIFFKSPNKNVVPSIFFLYYFHALQLLTKSYLLPQININEHEDWLLVTYNKTLKNKMVTFKGMPMQSESNTVLSGT